MLRSVLYYFLIFFIYSILGWAMESIYVSILQKKFVDRGFLIGPYCPIYGCGSLIITLYLEQYKNNVLTVFILGVVICSILEYITSYLMEKIFKARWWDYSDKKFNLNGRVCGKNAVLFGVGGLLIIYVLQPILDKLLYNINDFWLLLFSILFLIIYITDTIISFNIASKLKKTLSTIEVKKDSTQEIKNLVMEVINSNKKINIFQKRLFKAFPDLHKFVKTRESKFRKIKELFNQK